MISLQDVRVEYAVKGQPARRVLNGIHLEIQAGEFVSVVGQTGCGKSTLLRLILGEEKPSSGRVLVGGVERPRPHRDCGYVPQKYSLFPDKTVLQNVTFGPEAGLGPLAALRPAKRRRMRQIREQALQHLRRTGLDDADARKYPHQLSGGMQQRVAIAQALIMSPAVLLMDEPFSALDAATRAGMQRLIKDLWRESGATIVFVTHDTREAVCLGSRIVALAKDTQGNQGASITLDLAVPHLDFDSGADEIAALVRRVEASTRAGAASQVPLPFPSTSDLDLVPVANSESLRPRRGAGL
jgi:NitT/TauT family transport system ATP-binding protein